MVVAIPVQLAMFILHDCVLLVCEYLSRVYFFNDYNYL